MDFISHNKFSFQNWAIQLSQIIGKNVSKQAIFKRIGTEFTDFVKLVIAEILEQRVQKTCVRNPKLFQSFTNVHLQDATHFSLPLGVAHIFPGNNSKGAVRAVAKLVTVFNFKKSCFTNFKLTSFSEPDSSSISLMEEVLGKNDLVIRDLGYFSIKGFGEIIKKGAYFLSRYKLNVALFDIHTGDQICLVKILKKKKFIDQKVLLSSLDPTEVRIVAVPLPAHVVQERRRKAKADRRNKKTNHDANYYYLLGYSIYVTNVDDKVWTAKEVGHAYKCRWYIEILFKSWKSCLKGHYLEPDRYATETSVKTHFYLLIIYVCLFVMPLYLILEKWIVINKLNLQISLLKLTAFLSINLNHIITKELNDNVLKSIALFTKYDQRSDRNNIIKFASMGKLS